MKQVMVLGAGVAGLSTALYLRRNGASVTVLDPLPPAGGTSFGNAGLISPDSVVPIALPGMLRKVPSWLADPMGPLTIRPRHLPKVMPWLTRWISAGRASRVQTISGSLCALHRLAFVCWSELLGPEGMREFIRHEGHVYAWENDDVSADEIISRELRRRHDVETEMLSADEMRRMFPGIARSVVRGLLLPRNGHTVNPGRMLSRLADLLRAEGGTIVAERALKLLPRETGGWRVLSNTDNHDVDAVVVAAGAWSSSLLNPLGIHVPLAAERGYHVFLRNPTISVLRPIVFKDRGIALTPMEGGLRVTGTVEIDAHDAPPDERRAQFLERHVQQAFPGLRNDPPRFWMGSRPSTPDSLPILGEVPRRPGLFLCLGHGHFGMTGGPPSGKLVAESVMNQETTIGLIPYSLERFHADLKYPR